MTFDELENSRQALLKKRTKIKIILIPIFAAIIIALAIPSIVASINIGSSFFSLSLLAPIFFWGIFGFVIYILVSLLFTRKESAEWRKCYKEYFVHESLNKVFDKVQYLPNSGISKEVVRETGMMMLGNIYHSEDFISGKYKDVSFSQSDILIQNETTDSDGNKSTTTYLRGKWMIFEFPRDFAANLQVVKKGFHYYLRSGGIFSKKGNGKFPKKLETESVTFNKKFKVFAQDGFEAFYILDPSFIEATEWLGDNISGDFMLGFTNKTLHIALGDGKNSFEPPSFKRPVNEQVEFEKVSNEIRVITTFVDKLKLDKNLFRR